MKFDKTDLAAYIQVEELEEQGIWLEFPGGRGIRVKRAGGSNTAYARALQRAIRPYRGRGLENLDRATSDRIMLDVYASHVIVDWRGIRDEEGNDVPFERSAVIAFFEAFPELFQQVVTLAGEASLFSEQQIEEAANVLGEG